MGSRETVVLRLVLWLVARYLSSRYRLMSPEDLNQVVDDYLAELPKLGVKLVYEPSKVGEINDEIIDSNRIAETAIDSPRVSDLGQSSLV